MSDDAPVAETMWSGKYLSVHRQGTWEYASRTNDIHAAVILAVDDEDHVLLVEQYRVPLGARTIELPAGLVGDAGTAEAVEAAATRELEEETGYRPACVEPIGRFAASPGMTSETFTLVRATGLTRTGAGGGIEGEDIVVHRVPVAMIADFLDARRRAGLVLDAKLLVLLGAGLLAR